MAAARYETGGRAALPIWLDYMRAGLAARPQPEFNPPDGLDLVRLKVSPKTGKLVPPTDPKGVEMWFKKGTEPTELEEKGKAGINDFMLGPN